MGLGNLFNYIVRFMPTNQIDKNVRGLIEQQTKGAQTIAKALNESFCEALSLLAIWCSKGPIKTFEKIFKGQLVRDVIEAFGDDVSASLENLIEDLQENGQQTKGHFHQWLIEEGDKIQDTIQIAEHIKEKLCAEIKTLLAHKENMFPELEQITDYRLYHVFKEYLPIGKKQERILGDRIARNAYQILEPHHKELYLPAFFSSNLIIVNFMKEIFFYKIKQQQSLCNIVACLRQENCLEAQETLADEVKSLVELLMNKETPIEEYKDFLQNTYVKKNNAQAPLFVSFSDKETTEVEASRILDTIFNNAQGNKENEEPEKVSSEAFDKVLENAELFCKSILSEPRSNVLSNSLPIVEFSRRLFQQKNVFKLPELETQVKQLHHSVSLRQHLCWRHSEITKFKELSLLTHQTAAILYTVGKIEYIERATKLYHEALELAFDKKACGVIHFNLFICYLQLEKYDLALTHLSQACILDIERFAPFDLAKFAMLEILGYGCSGVVFKVLPLKSGVEIDKPCVLKTVWYGWGENANNNDQEFFEDSIRQEIECLKKIAERGYSENSKVIKYLGCGEFKERPYLLMEYFEGKSLGDWINNKWKGTPIFQNCVPILYQLAQAMEEVHQSEIYHLDIKPQNVLFNEKTKEIRLIDFGIARRVVYRNENNVLGNGLTKLSLNLAYSPEFASPEQKGQLVLKTGKCSDIYSFGKTACYLLTHNTDTGDLRNLPQEVAQFSPLVVKLNELIYACVIANANPDELVTLSETRSVVNGVRQTKRLNDISEILSVIKEVGISITEVLTDTVTKDEIEQVLTWYQSIDFFSQVIDIVNNMDVSRESKFDIFAQFLQGNPKENAFQVVLETLKQQDLPERQYQFIRQYLQDNPYSSWYKDFFHWAQDIPLGYDWKYNLMKEVAFGKSPRIDLLEDLCKALEKNDLTEQQRHTFWFGLIKKYPENQAVTSLVIENITSEWTKSFNSIDGTLSTQGMLLMLLRYATKQTKVSLPDIFEKLIFDKMEEPWQQIKQSWDVKIDPESFHTCEI